MSAWTPARWRASVVRMKSSLVIRASSRARGSARPRGRPASFGASPLPRGSVDLLAVLVGPGEEADVVAADPLVARHRVRHDGRVDVPDVGQVVDVVDRRRDVEGVARHGLSFILQDAKDNTAIWSALNRHHRCVRFVDLSEEWVSGEPHAPPSRSWRVRSRISRVVFSIASPASSMRSSIASIGPIGLPAGRLSP